MSNQIENKRAFLGTLSTDMPKGERQQRNYENKHLKAYLKGTPKFAFGSTRDFMGRKIPIMHDVKQEWK